jgi:predicted CXXCH cytochrome family protein
MSRMSKQAAARIGGILTGTAALFVGGVLIASAPAFADNGPHVTNQGTSALGSGPDGCAGCHRLHTAAGPDYLFRSQTTETAMCENCHGIAGTGASTDVIDGWSYTGTATSAVAPLRAGGFDKASIVGDSGTRNSASDPTNDRLITKAANAIGASNISSKVTTSKHAIEGTGTMWGYGTTGTGVTNVTLECTSCHNPHGNGNYRILRPVAYAGATTSGGATNQTASTNNYFVAPVAVASASAVATTIDGAAKWNYNYVTSTAHGLRPGQTVGITGVLPSGYQKQATVTAVADATHFTLGNQSTDLTATPSTAGGYVSQAWPQNIKSVSVDTNARTVTFTTWANHGLTAPLDNTLSRQTTQYVTITGAQAPAIAFNLQQVPVTAVPSYSSFTVTVPTATTMPSAADYTTGLSGGYIVGIPDSLNKTALGKVVYEQDNYWRADDHYYTGAKSSNLSPSALITVTGATRDAAWSNATTAVPVTYTTGSAHGLSVGNIVTVTGLFKSTATSTSSSLGLSAVVVKSVGDATHFTVDGFFSSDPGAAAVGINSATGLQMGYLSPKTSSAFINNVSQWCSTCHTRYLAGGSSRSLPNTTTAGVDASFTYRHTSNSAGEDSPNCIQCHVAHGSDAQMTGLYSANLNNPGDSKTATTDKGTAVAGDSRLLRADNRGICLLCHNM